jgi:molecular chaperone IbpA
MKTYDFAPLRRSSVGFDHLVGLLEESLRSRPDDSYPPYNIEKTGKNQYRIAVALAGFSPDEITLTARQNALTVEGRKAAPNSERQYLHRGISARPFSRVFKLADDVEVKGAFLKNGILSVDLVQDIPEAKMPRRIAIGASNGSPKIKQPEAA